MEAIRTIYLDTSSLAKLADDIHSPSSDVASVARAFIGEVNRCGYALFFSIHHIYELLAHGSDSTVDVRIRLIERLPVVAWCTAYEDDSHLGGCPDVQAFEADAAVRDQHRDWIAQRSFLRDRITKFGDGSKLASDFVEPILMIRELGLLNGASTSEVESIVHTAESEFDDLTIDELRASKFKTPEAIRRFYANYSLSVQKRLTLRGDHKVADTASAARRFAEMATIDPERIFSNGSFDLHAFLKECGVRPEQVDGGTTAREIGQLGVFNRQIDLLVDRSVISRSEALQLTPEQFPSWQIREKLDRATKAEKIAKGSSLVDRHHAAYAPYVDRFQGDKRTRHYIERFNAESGPTKSAMDALVPIAGYAGVLVQ